MMINLVTRSASSAVKLAKELKESFPEAEVKQSRPTIKDLNQIQPDQIVILALKGDISNDSGHSDCIILQSYHRKISLLPGDIKPSCLFLATEPTENFREYIAGQPEITDVVLGREALVERLSIIKAMSVVS